MMPYLPYSFWLTAYELPFELLALDLPFFLDFLLFLSLFFDFFDELFFERSLRCLRRERSSSEELASELDEEEEESESDDALRLRFRLDRVRLRLCERECFRSSLTLFRSDPRRLSRSSFSSSEFPTVVLTRERFSPCLRPFSFFASTSLSLLLLRASRRDLRFSLLRDDLLERFFRSLRRARSSSEPDDESADAERLAFLLLPLLRLPCLLLPREAERRGLRLRRSLLLSSFISICDQLRLLWLLNNQFHLIASCVLAKCMLRSNPKSIRQTLLFLSLETLARHDDSHHHHHHHHNTTSASVQILTQGGNSQKPLQPPFG